MRTKSDWGAATTASYNNFKKKYPNVKLEIDQWRDIIYSFNRGYRDHLIESGSLEKLSSGLGEFQIIKKRTPKSYTTKAGKVINLLPIDWKKTKEKGKVIYHLNYHTEGYKFNCKWFLKNARFKVSYMWKFCTSRETSRLIASTILNNPEAQYKFIEI